MCSIFLLPIDHLSHVLFVTMQRYKMASGNAWENPSSFIKFNWPYCHCTHPKNRMLCFEMCIQCEMITTIKLMYLSLHTVTFCLMCSEHRNPIVLENFKYTTWYN
jgi:hypothetical protein